MLFFASEFSVNGPASCHVERLLIWLSWLISLPVYFQFIISRLTTLEFPPSSWTPLRTLTNTWEASRLATFLPVTGWCPESAVSWSYFQSNNFLLIAQTSRRSVAMMWWSSGWHSMTPSLASSTLQVSYPAAFLMSDFSKLEVGWVGMTWVLQTDSYSD